MKNLVTRLVLVLAMLIPTAATFAQENQDSINSRNLETVENLRLQIVEYMKTKPGEGIATYYYAKGGMGSTGTRYTLRFEGPSGHEDQIQLFYPKDGKTVYISPIGSKEEIDLLDIYNNGPYVYMDLTTGELLDMESPYAHGSPEPKALPLSVNIMANHDKLYVNGN